MAHLSEQNDEIADINMTPFVDIVLVILIIFMVTATFISQGKIPLNLPQANTAENSYKEKKVTTISLTKDGQFYYDDEAIRFEEMEAKISMQKEATENIILRSDAQTPFELVVKVIDLCKRNNIHSFAIQTLSNHH